MDKKKNCYLSLVIPVYNEHNRIEKGLATAVDYLKKSRYDSEIIIVDDGSSDYTKNLAEKCLKKFPHKKILQHSKNRGKGAAVRTGVLAASGKYILFSDIDFSTPLSELPKLLKELKNSDIAIGVRRDPRAKILKHQPFFREFLGNIFTRLANILVTPWISDTTCGFKAYRLDSAKKIFTISKIDRWAFDAEILFLAQKFRMKIAQVPVVWVNDAGTKVHIFADAARALYDIFRVRVYDISGDYKGS